MHLVYLANKTFNVSRHWAWKSTRIVMLDGENWDIPVFSILQVVSIYHNLVDNYIITGRFVQIYNYLSYNKMLN